MVVLMSRIKNWKELVASQSYKASCLLFCKYCVRFCLDDLFDNLSCTCSPVKYVCMVALYLLDDMLAAVIKMLEYSSS